jgi:hypothetical protein
MGKSYFEFLEDAFQVLTSQVQSALAEEVRDQQNLATEEDKYASEGSFIGDNNSDSSVSTETKTVTLPMLFTRCRGIFQKMYFEAESDPEFQDRLDLYKIQLQSLTKYYAEMEAERAAAKTHEITFNFLDEAEDLDEEDWSESV